MLLILVVDDEPDVELLFALADSFLKEVGAEVGDIRSARPMDAEKLSSLLLRVYAQSPNHDAKSQCLDKIDALIRLRSYRLLDQLSEYER